MKYRKLSRNDLKRELIMAHRNQDWNLAAVLSQEKERRKKMRYCEVCGLRIDPSATRCTMHSIIRQFYPRALATALLLCATLSFGGTVTLGWHNPQQQPAETVELWQSPVLTNIGLGWSLALSTNAYSIAETIPTNAVFELWLPGSNTWSVVNLNPDTGERFTNVVLLRTNISVQVDSTHDWFFVVRYANPSGPGPFSDAAQFRAAPGSGWLWVK